ncbi:hypothetical protein [Clostridium fallax]|uniref:ABC-2 family transporter protein n=1 Tax=Clostridium fallax TaxID=1533 RepID=A0A1M4SL60_9CLOT|nr:hypothetical protein [Clostridium fallax]SHE32983.1 hypothetical protein SAMN05443638_10176 [Clostridium fallax]SQB07877.1 membrane protein [Clostridium fallax]
MKNLVISEFYRMIHSKKYKILLLIAYIVFILNGFYIRIFNLGFYDPLTTIELNSLNGAPFILREFHLFLFFIFCPIVFSDIFNHEDVSGSYRLIMLRPYKKIDFIISRIITSIIFTGLFVFSIAILGILFGYLFLDKTSSTVFFDGNNYNLVGAFLYNLKFYGVEFIILLSLLGISSIVGILSPNSVIAYLGSLSLCVGLVYLSQIFRFMAFSSQFIFDVLNNKNTTLIISCTLIAVITLIASVIIFKRKDYLY